MTTTSAWSGSAGSAIRVTVPPSRSDLRDQPGQVDRHLDDRGDEAPRVGVRRRERAHPGQRGHRVTPPRVGLQAAVHLGPAEHPHAGVGVLGEGGEGRVAGARPGRDRRSVARLRVRIALQAIGEQSSGSYTEASGPAWLQQICRDRIHALQRVRDAVQVTRRPGRSDQGRREGGRHPGPSDGELHDARTAGRRRDQGALDLGSRDPVADHSDPGGVEHRFADRVGRLPAPVADQQRAHPAHRKPSRFRRRSRRDCVARRSQRR